MDERREAMSPEALRLLEEQLGRMRSMLYNYYDQFYRFLYVSIVILFALMVVALAGVERAILLSPFYVIYVGFHSSYLFSYVIFARTYATAIERRLSRHVGADLLIAHELEAAYIFPISRRRFVAFSPGNRGSFLSAETVQFTATGALLFAVLSVWSIRVAWDSSFLWGLVYLVGLLVWGAGNLGYLMWYYFVSDYERRPRAILEARYGISFTGDDGAPF
ncbi:MAG: hypothetical protein M3439_01525 [Chloroflexota bacterium]|nr:hypothetical protein [Chloroflexota bacterium]